MAYGLEYDTRSSTRPYRVSNPDTGYIEWFESEKEAQDVVTRGNSRLMLPTEGFFEHESIADRFIEGFGDPSPDEIIVGNK